jgi:glycosyltransferase involved in cell wall biosynthesis
MRIVALLAARNEELYLERCLRHLVSQGIEVCVIDNESTDRTREIAEGFLGRGVCQIETYPFPGYQDLIGILKFKEKLAAAIDADWFIHHDADEIREAPPPFRTLRDAICAANAEGYTTINFDEFVFVPTTPEERFEGTDYVAEMRFYYYFARPKHRVNAWKKTGAEINLSTSAGHQVQFAGSRLWPTPLILRHYIILSAAHGQRKYTTERIYSEYEVVELGWRRNDRSKWANGVARLPPRNALKELNDAGAFDRSDPHRFHLLTFERVG